ncbi:MAG TPA: hypothetical protein VN841_17630 [Bryobacteraceae bacterium]|nr:hypothetical protein [Bryobacteraceae bacterium]
MATDYAGQRLLFTTGLSQTGSGQPDYGKLFVADWRGVTPLLIYNRDVLSTTGQYPGESGLLTNFYDVDGVDISSSGAYISAMASRACAGYNGGLCGVPDQSTLYDTSGQVALTAGGKVFLSRNGKRAMGFSVAIEGGASFVLYDLTTGAKLPVSGAGSLGSTFYALADDGTAVIGEPGYLLVYRPPASIQYIPSTLGVWIPSAVIDAAAAEIVWEQLDSSGNPGLRAVRTLDLTKPVTLAVNGWIDSQPHISDDGSRIMFLSTPETANDPQVFVMAADGTGRQRVTAEPDGIAQAVLSGNGQVVWALTRTGRLLKIDIASGANTQYTEPLAAFLNGSYSNAGGAPGQVVSLAASVMPGERVEITVQGQLAPVLRVDPQKVVFQIPWTAAPYPNSNSATVAISKPDSPLWSGDKTNLFLNDTQPALLASVHQDFSALVTAQQPAYAGEIIHFYGTGFGPVTPPVPDGTPAPITPLSRTVNPVTCEVLNSVGTDTGPSDVLFSGLAPGMIGIYQLDVRLPDQLPAGSFVQVRCSVSGAPTTTQVPILH